jgi:hypothetical protein
MAAYNSRVRKTWKWFNMLLSAKKQNNKSYEQSYSQLCETLHIVILA